MTHRSWPDAGAELCWPARCNVAEALLLVFALIEQEIDVVEQKLAALVHRDGSRRTSGDDIGSLGENPWIAEDTTADEHTIDARFSSARRSARARRNRHCQELESASRSLPC